MSWLLGENIIKVCDYVLNYLNLVELLKKTLSFGQQSPYFYEEMAGNFFILFARKTLVYYYRVTLGHAKVIILSLYELQQSAHL